MRLVDTYTYRAANGEPRYTVTRYDPKGFHIQDPVGQPLPDPVPEDLACLYRLPELIAASPAETVYVAEGEKDTDALVSLGLVATTNPCGTRMGWRSRYTDALVGRHVVIIPDADGPGLRHAEAVMAALRDRAASVATLHLHRRRGPWDVSDWIARGGTADKLRRLVREGRYRAAGIQSKKNPRREERERLVLGCGRLGATDRLTLLVIEIARGWNDQPSTPTAQELATLAGLHRVTVANTLSRLRRRGILLGYGIHWENLAALVAGASTFGAPPERRRYRREREEDRARSIDQLNALLAGLEVRRAARAKMDG